MGYSASNSDLSSWRRFESCPLRCTNVVKTTTFSLQAASFGCPVAYPVALPDPACLGVAVQFSCDSSRWVGSAAVPIGRPRVRLQASEALAAHGVEVDHVTIRQTVGKLRRRHGLLMSGEPREAGYRVEDWTWEARRVRSTGLHFIRTGPTPVSDQPNGLDPPSGSPATIRIQFSVRG